MKKIISVVLSVVMLMTAMCVYSNAQTTYNAKYTLTAEVNGKSYTSSDTVTVSPGSTVSVALYLKNDFMIGVMSAQVFYNKNIFESASGAFNKDGKFYSVCGKSMSFFTDWDNLASDFKEKRWPDYSAEKLADFKANHKFCYVSMATNGTIASSPARNLDEKIITITFKVSSSAKNGTTGQIIIPTESIRRKDYLNGFTMCSVYTKDDITSSASPYVDGLTYNMKNAVLNFKVSSSAVNLGDVNGDGKINSADALLTLQHSVGQRTLTGNAKTAADVTKDGTINSSDALKILQYSVGNISSF